MGIEKGKSFPLFIPLPVLSKLVPRVVPIHRHPIGTNAVIVASSLNSFLTAVMVQHAQRLDLTHQEAALVALVWHHVVNYGGRHVAAILQAHLAEGMLLELILPACHPELVRVDAHRALEAD